MRNLNQLLNHAGAWKQSRFQHEVEAMFTFCSPAKRYQKWVRIVFLVAVIGVSCTEFALSQSPGGVTGATLWLRADAGTSSTTNNSGVNTWTNQASGSGHATTTVNAGYTNSGVAAPLYQSGDNTLGINFNPVLNFNGNKWLDGNGSFSTHNVFVVAKFPTTPSSNGPTIIGFDRSSGTGGGLESSFYAYSNAYGYQAGAANGNYVEADFAFSVGAVPTVFEGRHVSNTSMIATVNAIGGSTYIQAGSIRPNPYTGKYRLGKTSDNMAAIESGVLAEVISFNSNLSAADRLKVQTYLGLKYGITMGNNANPVNYTASDGTVLWTGSTTFQNNIAGIVRDDASVLFQKQSRSVNAGLQIAIGNGNSIAIDNITNASTFSTDKSALIWGDNAGSAAAWTTTGAPLLRTIISRKWKVQETGTVGSVKVQVADNSGSNGLPSESTTIYLLTDADGDFTTGATETAMILNGTNWETSFNFNTGQYFTFATQNTAPVNLSLAMTVNNNEVAPGGALQYVLTLTNSGTTTATNVKVKDQLPGGVSYTSYTASTGTYDPATGIWSLPVVVPGNATLTLNVIVQ